MLHVVFVVVEIHCVGPDGLGDERKRGEGLEAIRVLWQRKIMVADVGGKGFTVVLRKRVWLGMKSKEKK